MIRVVNCTPSLPLPLQFITQGEGSYCCSALPGLLQRDCCTRRKAMREGKQAQNLVRQCASGPMRLRRLPTGSAGGGMMRELGPGEANTSVALVSAREPGWPLLFVSDGFASETGDTEPAHKAPIPSVSLGVPHSKPRRAAASALLCHRVWPAAVAPLRCSRGPSASSQTAQQRCRLADACMTVQLQASAATAAPYSSP